MMKYGADGYGLYWYCIELIASRVAPDNIKFELKHDAEVLGYHLKIDTLRVEEIMKYMISIGLFEASGDVITCMKLAKRLDNTLSQNKFIKETLSNFKKLSPEENRLDKNRLDKAKHSSDHSIERITKTPHKKIPYKEIVEIYHKILPLHSKVEVLNVTRKGYLKRLWFDDDGIGLPDLQHWENFFTYIKQSQFLTGQVQSHDRKPFIPNLEWLTKPANYLKITEGFYHG